MKIEFGFMRLSSFTFIPTVSYSWNDWGNKILFEFALWDFHIDIFK